MNAEAKARKLAAHRIDELIGTRFTGNVREAARVLGVKHNTLWRTAKGLNVRGPSAEMCEALEKLTGKPMRYWRGSEA